MIYTRVLHQGSRGVKSPADILEAPRCLGLVESGRCSV